MKQDQVPSAAEPNVVEATQESRAKALWENHLHMLNIGVDMDGDLASLIGEEQDIKQRLKDAKTRLDAAFEAHPLRGALRACAEQQTLLKAQFLNSRKLEDPKTITLPSGDKVQVRASQKAIITNGKEVARILMEKDLWEAANVQVLANEDMLVPLIENGVLAGAAVIEDKTSVALIPRK